MKMFAIEETYTTAGITVPFWISVLERGRGPRKSNKDHGLWKIIFRWMEKHNMFKAKSASGRVNEAKSMTWYINKYGNKHFRSKTFIDIYHTERDKTVEKVFDKFDDFINKVTMEAI